MFRRRVVQGRGTYTDWWWPPPSEDDGHSALEHVLVPEIDPGPDSTYFWAHQFRTAAGEGGYIGLQTKGNRADGSLGKMAIFSFWDTLGAEGMGTVRFGGEGTGWSCRIPYIWKPERPYRFRVEAVDGDEKARWWGAWVVDEESGDEQEIGLIAAPAKWGGLGEWSIMWTEYYGAPITRCADLLYSSVVFSTPEADHGVPPVRWNDHLGDGTCENSRITRVDGGVRHEVGRPAHRPEQPSERDDGPERPSERGDGPEQPSERGDGPE